MKTQVTGTSIEAYRTHDKKRQLEQFARYVLARTEAGQRTWDKQVYRDTGILPNTVSARRNDIEDMGGIELDGKKYRLVDAGTSKDPITRKRINTYALVLAGNNPQLSMF